MKTVEAGRHIVDMNSIRRLHLAESNLGFLHLDTDAALLLLISLR